MILQYHKTLSMISMMLSQCPISYYASETYQVLSPQCAFLAIPIFAFPYLLVSALFFTCVCAHRTYNSSCMSFVVHSQTVYIGIAMVLCMHCVAMVFVFSPYIREAQFLLSVSKLI